MPPTVVQRGQGTSRTLIVCYLSGAEAAVKLAPNAIVLSDNQPSFSEAYGNIPGRRGIASYPTLLTLARDVSGATIERVILVGFSEGAQAIRTHALDGFFADAAVCADGTHIGIPAEPEKLAAWKALASRARWGGSPFLASHSCIPTEPAYLSTRRTLELMTGWSLPKSDAIEPLGKHASGNLQVWSYGGTTAPAHVYQAVEVLPMMLQQALGMRGMSAGQRGALVVGGLALGAGLVWAGKRVWR